MAHEERRALPSSDGRARREGSREPRLERLAAAFRQEEHRGCGGQEGQSEEREQQRGAAEGHERGHDERCRNRGQASNTGRSTGAGAAQVSREDFRAQGVERTPGTQVEEGEQATGDDDEHVGVRQAVSRRGQRGSNQEGGQGSAAAPLLDEVGGHGVTG